MAIALPAHLPGVVLIQGTVLSGRMRNTDTGTGAFSLYLRVRTAPGGSGTLFQYGPLQVTVSGPAYTAAGLVATGTVGRIQHLVFVRRADGSCTLYLDGTAVGNGTFTNSVPAGYYSIGPWAGRIYRTCFWNRDLSPADVAALPSHGPADSDRWGSATSVTTS